MSERDIDKRVPTQRQPPKLTSLYDVLTATAEQSAERARIVTGTNVHRRVAGYIKELTFALNALATKWGVDPRDIPIQIFPGRKPLHPAASITPHVEESLAIPKDDTVTQVVKPLIPPRTHELLTTVTAAIEEIRESLVTPRVQEVLTKPQKDALASFRTSGDLLQYILGQTGITQREIAVLLGKSKSWVEKVGRTRPFKIGDAHQLCDMLELAEDHPYRMQLIHLITKEARASARSIQEKGFAELDK